MYVLVRNKNEMQPDYIHMTKGTHFITFLQFFLKQKYDIFSVTQRWSAGGLVHESPLHKLQQTV